ncbi:MAG TPA: undecaprenyl-diphosphate phosphatase, partial [Gammaproteobacteria bacterium]|nr:undecaprenyl-diphosphate phosphatase [Gammaproteobacteria bacterium]
SSGHLVIFQGLFGVRVGEGIVFEVAVHLATLAAILLFYRRRIWALVNGLLKAESHSWHFVTALCVGTLPIVVFALLARDWIGQQYESLVVVGVCLLATGGIVWTTRYTKHGSHSHVLTWKVALLIGCAQAVAVLPGISRSGATVAAAMALGIAPLAAAEFSFLLGAIAIVGASILQIPELSGITSQQMSAIAIGSVAALISGLGAIWLFVRLLQGKRFHNFAWYAWLLGAATLISVGVSG